MTTSVASEEEVLNNPIVEVDQPHDLRFEIETLKNERKRLTNRIKYLKLYGTGKLKSQQSRAYGKVMRSRIQRRIDDLKKLDPDVLVGARTVRDQILYNEQKLEKYKSM